ncbi:hypothetical protein AF335_03010 [Streptomyces eurocidicus]|uniref:Uncharacterized protein n=1 Tax=Streptomyces eurocidicus TaxID=66423 RepID=A0A2N8P2V2_STREU|nr:hypothetical protein [Streptomyces eurocidicus]MBB5117496.1 hypothetical protein [Streptomyces eurocidicus]MBF6053338.1 hypothetical protein [Streptomyces eurocidicus]PNE35339.1 hypothetical protein AF335_03010 [Streptomyces eurocidicus]
MSHHQPGPFGAPQPPQQPPSSNPYGQPAQPGPGQGYPPQPPYGAPQPNPYGGGSPQQPPNPYGQPYGGPGAPGQYPPPIPPQGGGKGKTIGIAAGAVVLVAAIVAGVVLVAGGGKSDGKDDKADGGNSASPSAGTSSAPPAPAKKYKLVAPDVVVGDYKKDTAKSTGGFDSKDLSNLRLLGVVNPQNVTGSYKSGGAEKTSQKLLRFTGAWGDDVRDPEAVVDGLFKDIRNSASKDTDKDSKTEFEGSPQRMSTAGLGDAVLKCQMSKWSTPGSPGSKELRMPLCIWADKTTVGTVFALDASLIVQGLDLDLEEAAKRTVRLRQDVRVETTEEAGTRAS